MKRMPKKTPMAHPRWPDAFWTLDFMKFNDVGRPIEGTSWRWSGITFNARMALDKAIDALVDEKSGEGSNWRCVRLAMDLQAVVAMKSATPRRRVVK